MGSIDKSVRSRVRRQSVQNAVLSVVAVAGLLAWNVVAPKTLLSLKYEHLQKRAVYSRAVRARRNLLRRGLLEEVRIDGVRTVRVSKKGELMLARLAAGSASYKKPSRWDEQWRVVIFDIPEYRRDARDKLRTMLERIGFKMLQASVWVFPYECEDLLNLLKTEHALGKEVLYIVSGEIENDNWLRRKFKLHMEKNW